MARWWYGPDNMEASMANDRRAATPGLTDQVVMSRASPHVLFVLEQRASSVDLKDCMISNMVAAYDSRVQNENSWSFHFLYNLSGDYL